MQQLKFTILIITIVSLVSCTVNKKEEKSNEVLVDTSMSKLNSASLKTVNAKILENPDNPDLYIERAKLYLDNKDFEASLSDIKRAQKFDTVKAEYYLVLTDVYFYSGQTRLAKEVLEKSAKLNPEHVETKLKLAELFFYVKKYQESINYINEVIKIEPTKAKAYYLKGMCYKESADTNRAISSFQTATEQDPKQYDANMQLGALMGARKNILALEYFNNALRIDPKSTEAVYSIGKFYQDIGKIQEAIDTYKKLLAVDKNNSHALYNLGAIEFSFKKDPKAAIQYFSDAINLKSDYAEAYFARGVCFEKLKDLKNAEADYRAAVQYLPNYTFAIENLNRLTGGK